MLKPSVIMTSATIVTRIQFRLPSGNPHLGQFEPTSTLRELRTYIAQNIELPFRQFTISTSFPRKDLTHEEDGKTLLELQLVPTAVILILPLKNVSDTLKRYTFTLPISKIFIPLIYDFSPMLQQL